jgi:hypothetical protein
MEKLTALATGEGSSEWTADEQDGSLSRFTTIWVVRVGADLYVRSARGDAASSASPPATNNLGGVSTRVGAWALRVL